MNRIEMKELEEKNIQLQKEIDIIRTNYIRALRENEVLKTIVAKSPTYDKTDPKSLNELKELDELDELKVSHALLIETNKEQSKEIEKLNVYKLVLTTRIEQLKKYIQGKDDGREYYEKELVRFSKKEQLLNHHERSHTLNSFKLIVQKEKELEELLHLILVDGDTEPEINIWTTEGALTYLKTYISKVIKYKNDQKEVIARGGGGGI